MIDMDLMEEYNALLKILMDPKASDEAREMATAKMQELSTRIQQQAMAGAGKQGGNMGGKQQMPPTGGGDPGPGKSGPGKTDVPSLAKKYYDHYSGALPGGIGTVNFDGRSSDNKKAEELCNAVALMIAFQSEGKTIVATAAAAVGASSKYARASGSLASALQHYDLISDKYRLEDAKILAEYAISLDKNDIDLFITLALVLQDLGDIDGALKAIDNALNIDKKNVVALTVKMNLLAKGGGGASRSSIAREIGNDLVENDGELSKRATEQENAAKGIDGPKDDDSKDAALKKLDQLYGLDPITPSDMVKKIMPQQANEMSKKIRAVSETDKNLGLPEFPMKLMRDLEAYTTGGYVKYGEWWKDQYMARINMSNELSSSKGRPAGQEMAAADYMREYNKQVVRAAISNYIRFTHRIWEETLKVLAREEEKVHKKHDAAQKKYMANLEAGMNPKLAEIKYATECNEFSKESANIVIPELYHWYTECRREGQKLWEEMLPYARCTDYPGYEVAHLYRYVLDHSAPAMTSAGLLNGVIMHYVPGFTEADVQAVLSELSQAGPVNKPETLEGLTLSATFGPVEVKLSANGVELEVAAGLAMRAAFNPTKGTAELGVGVGYQARVGVSGAGIGVSAKAFTNVVFDLKNNEVSDIYYTAEAKGSFAGFEGGGQVKISAFGKGASISSTAKQSFGGFYGVEHETELIKLDSF